MEGVKKGETQGLTACATQVAVRVIEVALEADLCTKISPEDVPNDGDLARLVSKKMYDPRYAPLVDPSYGN